MNRIRPRSYQESGKTALEVDAFEQAIEESKLMNRGAWLDLFSRTYLKRTIVSATDQAAGQSCARTDRKLDCHTRILLPTDNWPAVC